MTSCCWRWEDNSRTLADQDRFVNKCLFPSACEASVFLGSHAHNLLPEAGPKGDGQSLHSTMAVIKYPLPTAVKYFTACDSHYHLCTVNWLASADTLLENPWPHLLGDLPSTLTERACPISRHGTKIHEGTACLLEALVSCKKALSGLWVKQKFGYAFSIGNLSLNMMDGCIKQSTINYRYSRY